MKTIKTLLLTTAVVALGVTFSVKADQSMYSPKAKEQADSLRTVATSQTDADLAVGRPNGNVRAWRLSQSLHTASADNNVDLAHAQRPALTAKDPNYDAAWRNNAEHQVQVAPMK